MGLLHVTQVYFRDLFRIAENIFECMLNNCFVANNPVKGFAYKTGGGGKSTIGHVEEGGSDQVKTDGIQQDLKYFTDNLGTTFFDVAYGAFATAPRFAGKPFDMVSKVHLFARKKGPFNGCDLDAMAIKYGMRAQRYNFPYGSNNPPYYMLRFSE
ncbi:hypothetical protein E3N88_40662 [Mikania micrantha]|uniref:Uncharacterized protein n=1 Tax=Mikania micrantha TaxID=192012 RepID=A0A5N6LND1_9ASTR|nr:hypothetical protein E3N88_40662 [Mikania micrantha]